ncbi:hypothetical protein Clacol_002929 [Clathrus columnatus]|uniref:RNA polymerase II-associated protein 3 n=1 Tax=Clathrus columnatus TaxID=1419009 RepID=A0AAV5A9W8_9AGAM|nr:hypothetical protein Clacol_002929 [Clathrus columnatus]
MPVRPTRKRRSKRKYVNNDEEEFDIHIPSPLDTGVAKTMTSIAQMERCIARILLLRYQQDIARLFATRIHNIALEYLPKLIHHCVALTGPGWVANNADSEEIKDFFRAALAMDLRQSGERVATKSVLWSYTALRHFAISHNIQICEKRGLHSLRLLPYYPQLKTHMNSLEASPPPTFAKPPHLGPLTSGLELLEGHCLVRDKTRKNLIWDNWQLKLKVGYEGLVDTLWRTAREFDVRGYGLVLREKLTTKWCDCGCSTDHLGEVCERTVRDDEEEAGKRAGKEREWDGRGSGVWGWETKDEEDVWETRLDFGGVDPDECDGADDMSIGEMMEWRYIKAERAKERGNEAFKKQDYQLAIRHYIHAHEIEPELPHYQLNLAAAYLKLENWSAAERACTMALSQHKSTKGYWRRAKARKMLDRPEEAARDLRMILRLQPNNTEALAELSTLVSPSNNAHPPTDPINYCSAEASSSSPSPHIHPSPPDKHPKPPFPFTLHDVDHRKLKIVMLPLELPVPSMETLNYPSWDRFEIRRID